MHVGQCHGLRADWIKNSKGAKTRVFDRIDLGEFRLQHISLKEIADAVHFSPKVMKMTLNARCLEPVVPKFELGRIRYRRCDVPDF